MSQQSKPANFFTTTFADKTKYQSFNFIRGIAVLLVLFSHLDNFQILVVWPFSFTPLQGFIGQVGVELFFLLSGYLIWSSAKNNLFHNNGLMKYTINRITRIYPIYLTCILFIIAASSYFIGPVQPTISSSIILRHLLFLQSFEPSISHLLNGPFWTLTHEFLFYLLVPVLFFWKVSNRNLLISIVITQVVFYSVDGLHAFANYWLLFATGILICEQKKVVNKWLSITLLLVIAFVCIIYPSIKLYEFMFSIALFSFLLNFDFKSFIFKPLIGLGLISYSVYIWHAMLIHLIMPHIREAKFVILPIKPWLPEGVFLEGLLMIALILTFSSLTYFVIEKPFMHDIRHLLIRKLEKPS